jgi:hypothetical protein
VEEPRIPFAEQPEVVGKKIRVAFTRPAAKDGEWLVDFYLGREKKAWRQGHFPEKDLLRRVTSAVKDKVITHYKVEGETPEIAVAKKKSWTGGHRSTAKNIVESVVAGTDSGSGGQALPLASAVTNQAVSSAGDSGMAKTGKELRYTVVDYGNGTTAIDVHDTNTDELVSGKKFLSMKAASEWEAKERAAGRAPTSFRYLDSKGQDSPETRVKYQTERQAWVEKNQGASAVVGKSKEEVAEPAPKKPVEKIQTNKPAAKKAKTQAEKVVSAGLGGGAEAGKSVATMNPEKISPAIIPAPAPPAPSAPVAAVEQAPTVNPQQQLMQQALGSPGKVGTPNPMGHPEGYQTNMGVPTPKPPVQPNLGHPEGYAPNMGVPTGPVEQKKLNKVQKAIADMLKSTDRPAGGVLAAPKSKAVLTSAGKIMKGPGFGSTLAKALGKAGGFVGKHPIGSSVAQMGVMMLIQKIMGDVAQARMGGLEEASLDRRGAMIPQMIQQQGQGQIADEELAMARARYMAAMGGGPGVYQGLASGEMSIP